MRLQLTRCFLSPGASADFQPRRVRRIRSRAPLTDLLAEESVYFSQFVDSPPSQNSPGPLRRRPFVGRRRNAGDERRAEASSANLLFQVTTRRPLATTKPDKLPLRKHEDTLAVIRQHHPKGEKDKASEHHYLTETYYEVINSITTPSPREEPETQAHRATPAPESFHSSDNFPRNFRRPIQQNPIQQNQIQQNQIQQNQIQQNQIQQNQIQQNQIQQNQIQQNQIQQNQIQQNQIPDPGERQASRQHQLRLRPPQASHFGNSFPTAPQGRKAPEGRDLDEARGALLEQSFGQRIPQQRTPSLEETHVTYDIEPVSIATGPGGDFTEEENFSNSLRASFSQRPPPQFSSLPRQPSTQFQPLPPRTQSQFQPFPVQTPQFKPSVPFQPIPPVPLAKPLQRRLPPPASQSRPSSSSSFLLVPQATHPRTPARLPPPQRQVAHTSASGNFSVFHICQLDQRQDSFICPNGTLFNQEFFVCDWAYNVRCDRAQQYYVLNADLYNPDAIFRADLQESDSQQRRYRK
ncbi:unnamed protein product [Cyprideis torosa]|uniref:Uncharacterized protein n=1 Tax=Cyprideis torosa TaxID=163714 RepID=A0A7R8W4M8_9CRUS|nr:unnamed protein product [Cyprideis torosa]CAG0884386.1 unnamed protein product [Cyprideis torosa]